MPRVLRKSQGTQLGSLSLQRTFRSSIAPPPLELLKGNKSITDLTLVNDGALLYDVQPVRQLGTLLAERLQTLRRTGNLLVQLRLELLCRFLLYEQMRYLHLSRHPGRKECWTRQKRQVQCREHAEEGLLADRISPAAVQLSIAALQVLQGFANETHILAERPAGQLPELLEPLHLAVDAVSPPEMPHDDLPTEMESQIRQCPSTIHGLVQKPELKETLIPKAVPGHVNDYRLRPAELPNIRAARLTGRKGLARPGPVYFWHLSTVWP
mmetsp:Transcript_40757/g.89079  ORF Transcript_40757/g.89079 Transcript_40757/m.89079 type:complete len:268 (-) Transcript_40757:1562-2365(-)